MSNHEAQRVERDQFEREVQELRQDRDRVASLDQDLSGTQGNVDELTEALRESEYQVSRLGTEIQLLRSVRTEFEALRNDNRDLEEDMLALRSEREEFENQIAELQRTIEDARDKQIAAEREILRLKQELVALRLSDSDTPIAAPAALSASAPSGQEDASYGIVYDMPPAEIDDLTAIDGISPGLETKLNQLGIYQYHQIAAWKRDQIEAFSDRLGFQDRIVRDRWMEQASALLEDAESEDSPDSLDAPLEPDDVPVADDAVAPSTPESTPPKDGADDESGHTESGDTMEIEEPSLFFAGFGSAMDENDDSPSAASPTDKEEDEVAEADGEQLSIAGHRRSSP